jgi:hypothetical protein
MEFDPQPFQKTRTFFGRFLLRPPVDGGKNGKKREQAISKVFFKERGGLKKKVLEFGLFLPERYFRFEQTPRHFKTLKPLIRTPPLEQKMPFQELMGLFAFNRVPKVLKVTLDERRTMRVNFKPTKRSQKIGSKLDYPFLELKKIKVKSKKGRTQTAQLFLNKES